MNGSSRLTAVPRAAIADSALCPRRQRQRFKRKGNVNSIELRRGVKEGTGSDIAWGVI